MQITKITPNMNNSLKKDRSDFLLTNYNNISFKSVPLKPESKYFLPVKNAIKFLKKHYHEAMEPIEDGIANGLAKLVESKPAQSLFKFTYKHNGLKKNLISHLIVLGSTLLSGFYVGKTLTNKKLDEKKRNTLALNQAGVFILSTIMAYSFDNMVTKKVDKVKDKFIEINKGKLNVDNQVKGIEAAKKIMIFTTMYRLIAPVIITPIANYIGNKVNANE